MDGYGLGAVLLGFFEFFGVLESVCLVLFFLFVEVFEWLFVFAGF